MTIKEIRQRYQLSQSELSRITGIPKRTIENWEEGHRTPPDYMPELILAKVKMFYINTQGGNDMANFDLGLARCRAKELAGGALDEYASYGRIHKVNVFDDTTEIGKNFDELWNMKVGIDKCTTEAEINKYLERIAELEAAVIE